MHRLKPDHLLNGKDEDARAQIARRTGRCLGENMLSGTDRIAAEVLAHRLAEDAIERVRCELSKAIRTARHLPRDLALKLAHDVDSVACPFLEVTEVFSDGDWQQLLLTISRNARVAVARRASMSETLAQSLAESADTVIAETLVENPMAPMTRSVCHVLVDRFASEAWVLDKLALRNDLIAGIAVKLTTHVSDAARAKLAKTYKLQDFTEPFALEAEITAILQVVKKTSVEDITAVVETLKLEGKLAPLLLLAALREPQLEFLEVALSLTARRSLEHVRSVLCRADRAAVTELLNRARIPAVLHDDFWTGIEIVRRK